jgi:hypothetical protein
MTTLETSAGAGATPAPAANSSLIQGLRPDITPAQIVAIVGNVVAVAIAFGAHITKQQQDAILALVGALGAFLIASDAHLRGRRAHATAVREAAATNAQAAATNAQAAATNAQAVHAAIAAGVAPPQQPQA